MQSTKFNEHVQEKLTCQLIPPAFEIGSRRRNGAKERELAVALTQVAAIERTTLELYERMLATVNERGPSEHDDRDR